MPHAIVLLRNAGISAVRYPGGSYGDGYHWQTHTVEGGGYVAPNTDFDGYVATVRAAGSQPIVIANYGSGTAQEAAEWVRYANITKGYGIRYWEIGNEIYGNGHYGAQWELDNHPSKSPRTYATHLVEYASAMKAVDPTIKTGAVLTTPNNWRPERHADQQGCRQRHHGQPVLQRFHPVTATPTVHSYRKNASSIGSAPSGSATTQTVPAYSIVVVQLRPGTGNPVGNAWNATVTQTGAAVTATNAGHNGTIPAGGSQSFGFGGRGPPTTRARAAPPFNGSSCTTG